MRHYQAQTLPSEDKNLGKQISKELEYW